VEVLLGQLDDLAKRAAQRHLAAHLAAQHELGLG
jgi:hypothetical protein